MKLKRNEFTTSFVVIALFAVTAAVTLLSAYGAVCAAWDPFWAMRFAYVGENILIFRISNVLTWVGAVFWGYVIFAVLTQKKFAYLMGLLTAVVSFIVGLVPAIIADTASWMSNNEGPVKVPWAIGSPHWARVFANLLVILVLIIPPVRKSVQKFASAENKFTGKVAQQIMLMSMFFFWLSLMSFLGTNFMASAHVVQGVNLWQLVEIQSIGAYATLITGVSMLSGGFILKQFNPSKSLITTVEVTK